MRKEAATILGPWLAALALAFGTPDGAAASQGSPPEGVWSGLLLIEPRAIEVEFSVELARDATGRWVGTYDQPDQGVRHLPFDRIEVEDGRVFLELVREIPEAGLSVPHLWEGSLSPGGEIGGRFTEGDQEPKPFVLRWRGPPGTEIPTPGAARVTPLSGDLAELAVAFNRGVGGPRLLLLLSPECPACLAGAGVVRRYVLETIGDPSLRLFVVWGPMLGHETPESAAPATARVADPRARHFWTGDQTLARSLEPALGLPQGATAWDTYTLFAPGAEWRGGPPEPVLSMHLRRGFPEDRRLDGEALADEVRRLLAGGR